MPYFYKQGVVKPGLKKLSLPSNVFLNFRPVTNLPYFSKLLERCVFSQLEDHLISNMLIPSSQSAYRKLHSTETSLLKVSNDILEALNAGKCTLLVTLDLSAAFDTVNHQMLLSRYKTRFGMNGTVLKWMTAYLQDRTQSVQIGDSQSDLVIVKTGFPQGSVLGGPKYNMHATPLDELISLHDINNQAYADDSNLYISFDMRDETSTSVAFSQMEHCLADVEFWMVKNELKLNCTKTVAVLFKPPNQSFIHQPTTLKVGSAIVGISTHFESLGVVFDQHMKMDKQVNYVTKSAYFQMRKISRVRRQLDRGITETLVNSLVTSRLDYCNSLLSALPKKTIKKLQYAQNAAAKTIMLAKKRDHVTPLLKELHWLPISRRCDFKVLVTAFRILNNSAPPNISNLVTEYVQSRRLRSANQRSLTRHGIPRNNYGKRAFINNAVSLWNDLPPEIRKLNSLSEFKATLKTHYFRLRYGPE